MNGEENGDPIEPKPDVTGCCGSTYPGRVHFSGCANDPTGEGKGGPYPYRKDAAL